MFSRNFKFFPKKRFLIFPYLLIAIIFIIAPMVIVFCKSVMPTSSGSSMLNWVFIDKFILGKIFKSIKVAFFATIIVIVLSYPFSYFLVFYVESKSIRTLLLLMMTAPTWISFLIKIIGLKTLFDCINGYPNSTFGDIYSILGLSYIYLPFMALPLYNTLSTMPKNLVLVSKDLGQNNFWTFIKVVFPYTLVALYSGISLVFLPSFTSISVPQFLNSSNSGSLIGDIIMEEGILAQSSDLSLARASSLSMLSVIIIFSWFLFYCVVKIIRKKIKRSIWIKYG